MKVSELIQLLLENCEPSQDIVIVDQNFEDIGILSKVINGGLEADELNPSTVYLQAKSVQ